MPSIPHPTASTDVRPHPSRKVRDIPLVSPMFESYPALPSTPRSPHFIPGYNLTTHIIPSAYPRQSFREPRRYPELESISSLPPSPEGKAEREAWALDIRSKMKRKWDAILHLRDRSHGSEALSDDEESPVLWNVVNRYARVRPIKRKDDVGVTLIVAHAIGFHKETWEPTIKHIIALCDRPRSNIHIDEVWALDPVNSGDSALLNEKYLGDFLDAIDHARDFLNLAENFIPEGSFVASPDPLPVYLDHVSPDCVSQRRKSGFRDRNVLGIGHSIGGSVLASAACANPHLFQSLTLIDPMILPNGNSGTDYMMLRPLLRRFSWSSRDEAKAHFSRNPGFKAWDPEVLDLYVQYGLVDIPRSAGGGVRLKMSGFQEATECAGNRFIQETYRHLGRLDEKVKLRWIMPTVPFNGDPPEYRQAMVWRRPANSSSVVLDLGHLMIQLAPLVIAKEIVVGWRVVHEDQHSARL